MKPKLRILNPPRGIRPKRSASFYNRIRPLDGPFRVRLTGGTLEVSFEFECQPDAEAFAIASCRSESIESARIFHGSKSISVRNADHV